MRVSRFLLLCCLAVPSAAQPAGEWVDLSVGAGPPPLVGSVDAAVYGPDGTLIVGGDFGGSRLDRASYLAEWTEDGWRTLGPALNGPVHDVFRKGDALYVVGTFARAGGVPIGNVGVLDLTTRTWSAPDVLFPGTLSQIVVTPDGQLTGLGTGGVMRLFDDCDVVASTPPAPCWRSIGGANEGTLRVGPRGEVVVGSSSYGTSGVGVTEWVPGTEPEPWDGDWVPLPGGEERYDPRARALALAVSPTDDRVGVLTAWDGVQIWDGTAWTRLPLDLGDRSDYLHRIGFLADGRFVVTGRFRQIGGVAADNLAAWDGVAWAPLADGAPTGVAGVVPAPSGGLALLGEFVAAGDRGSWRVVELHDGAWQGRGSAFARALDFSPAVYDVAVRPDGSVVAVGGFEVAGQVAAQGVALWDPDTGAWTAFRDWEPSPLATPTTVAATADGRVYVGGAEFGFERNADGELDERSGYGLAEWDPEVDTWQRYDDGLEVMLDPIVNALGVTSDGVLVAGGQLFTADQDMRAIVTRRPGDAAWVDPMPGRDDWLEGQAFAVGTLPDGTLLATGELFSVRDWGAEVTEASLVVFGDGAWQPVADVGPFNASMSVGPSGRVYLAGIEGAKAVADGVVTALPAEPWAGTGGAAAPGAGAVVAVDEALYLGGQVGDDRARGRVVRMAPDGSGWDVLGDFSPTGSINTPQIPVRPVAAGPDGGVFVVGEFHAVGNRFSSGLALWRPAGVVATGPVPDREPSLRATPNPVAGPLRVAHGPHPGTTLDVFDVLGRRVASEEVGGQSETVVATAGWAPGVYVVRHTADGAVRTATVTVAR